MEFTIHETVGGKARSLHSQSVCNSHKTPVVPSHFGRNTLGPLSLSLLWFYGYVVEGTIHTVCNRSIEFIYACELPPTHECILCCVAHLFVHIRHLPTRLGHFISSKHHLSPTPFQLW